MAAPQTAMAMPERSLNGDGEFRMASTEWTRRATSSNLKTGVRQDCVDIDLAEMVV